MSIERLLKEEIKTELTELSKIDLGTEEYKVTVDGLAKLMDRALEIEKVNLEFDERAMSREDDFKLKSKQLEEEQKNRKIGNYIAVAGIVVPTVVTVWGTIKSIKFEENGTITTIMGRGFINKLLPKK